MPYPTAPVPQQRIPARIRNIAAIATLAALTALIIITTANPAPAHAQDDGGAPSGGGAQYQTSTPGDPHPSSHHDAYATASQVQDLSCPNHIAILAQQSNPITQSINLSWRTHPYPYFNNHYYPAPDYQPQHTADLPQPATYTLSRRSHSDQPYAQIAETPKTYYRDRPPPGNYQYQVKIKSPQSNNPHCPQSQSIEAELLTFTAYEQERQLLADAALACAQNRWINSIANPAARTVATKYLTQMLRQQANNSPHLHDLSRFLITTCNSPNPIF